MKKIRTGGLAMSFAGCILGAGYVSGQELWQFFGAFGSHAFWGLVLAMILLVSGGVIILRTAQMSGIQRMDELIIPWDIPWLRRMMGVVASCSMVGVQTIMAAGAGALLNQVFGLPKLAGSLLLCVLVTLIAVFGVSGMVRVFSTVVPILVAVSLGVVVTALWRFGADAPAAAAPANSVQGFWAFSAVTYVSYGLFGSFGVLAALGQFLPDRKTTWRGVISGTVMLLVLASGILLSLRGCPSCVHQELPMLALAQQLGPFIGILFALLLFMGMLSTSQGCAVAVLTYWKQIRPASEHRGVLWAVILNVLTLLASSFGFSGLVRTVYPICGYFGFFAFTCLTIRAVRLKHGIRKSAGTCCVSENSSPPIA